MKKIKLFISSVFLLAGISSYAQAPELVNYQAALRDNDGVVLAEKAVSVRFTIIDAGTSGTEIYQEEHSTATNEYGLVNLKIGGGIALSGDFESVNWSQNSKFLKIEVRQGSGTYVDLGTQQLVSVPYALHSKNTSGIAGVDIDNTLPASGQVLKYDGTAWVPAADENTTAPTGAAGGDLAGTYPNPTIGDAQVVTTKLANNAVTTDKINNNAVTNAKIADNAVGTSKISSAAITAPKLHAMGASSGQVLKYDGTAWAPAADENTTAPTGAAGGDLAGTYPNPTIGDAQVVTAKLANNAVTTDKINNNAVTNAKIADNAVGTSKISSAAITAPKLHAMGASSGQVLKYNGTAWAPADDENTSYFTLTGLTLKRNGGTKLNLGFSISEASGNNATAIGNSTTASGDFSTAMGANSVASGIYSTSMGISTIASANSTTAMGRNTQASGIYSTSMGINTTASGSRSTAMGDSTVASGNNSTALGSKATASGSMSTAMGQNTTASGFVSTAMGYHTVASGQDAVAMGNETTASGMISLATGLSTTASGRNTTAMGSRVSTNNHEGSFIIGDYKSTTGALNATANNQMTMRFRGGYRLFTNLNATIGVSLAAGGSSWASISDSSKKENFLQANGADFLNKISTMRLGSWNYKGTNASTHRHYGPMAQEFYALFGHDGIGTIGNDTTIASADIDGVMMIALQELSLENKRLKEEIEALKSANKQLASTNDNLNAKVENLAHTQQEALNVLMQLQARMELREEESSVTQSVHTINAIEK